MKNSYLANILFNECVTYRRCNAVWCTTLFDIPSQADK